MENSKFTRNMIFISHFLMIFFCPIAIALDANAYSEILAKHDYNEIKTSILKWWKRNNVPENLECRYNPESAYNNKFFDLISAPEIISYPCTGDATSPHYYYEGTTKNNVLEGKGKLVFISNYEYSSLSHSDKVVEKVLESKIPNMCIKANDIYGREVKEVNGSFKEETTFLNKNILVMRPKKFQTSNSCSLNGLHAFNMYTDMHIAWINSAIRKVKRELAERGLDCSHMSKYENTNSKINICPAI